MTLLLVRKFPKGGSQTVKPVESHIVPLLYRWRGEDELTQEEDATLADFLAEHHSDWWILCPCGPDDSAESSPLLAIAERRGSGRSGIARYYPMRLAKRLPTHPDECLLAAERRSGADEIVDPEFKEVLLDPAREKARGKMLKGSALQRSVVPRVPAPQTPRRAASLHQHTSAGEYSVMAHLLMEGKLDDLRASHWREERAACEAAAERIWRQRPAIALARFLMVDPYALPRDLTDLVRPVAGWPRNEALVRFALLTVKSIVFDGRGTILDFERPLRPDLPEVPALELPFHLRVNATPEQLPVRAPFLTLLKAEACPDGEAKWVSGYAHAIRSRSNWTLMDSVPERECADDVFALSQSLQLRDLGVTLTIRKVLGLRRTPYGWVRPDFEITATFADGRVYFAWIEVMGSRDEEYLAGKRMSHFVMRSAAPVIDCPWHDRISRMESRERMYGETTAWLIDPEAYARRQESASGLICPART